MTERLLVALSAGGNPDELAEKGVGVEHVEEIMVRIAMQLLRSGHRLAFGGTLGDKKSLLTKLLIETAQSWLDEESAKATDVNTPDTWPMMNYSSWPHYKRIDAEQRARTVGICQFINIDPDNVPPAELDGLDERREDPRRQRYAADALSTMREQSACDADLRIVWGGKIAGASGWMAGILEEAAYSLEQKKPVIVLGGFGGCAGLVADFLIKDDAEWPTRLSLAECANRERDTLLSESERKTLEQRFEAAQELLQQYRKKLHSNKQIRGIETQCLRNAIGEGTPRRAIRYVTTAVQQYSKSR